MYAPKAGRTAFQTNARCTAPHSSNSNGGVGRATRLVRDQYRVTFGYLAHKFGNIFGTIPRIICWLVRHFSWILRRVAKKKSHTNLHAVDPIIEKIV